MRRMFLLLILIGLTTSAPSQTTSDTVPVNHKLLNGVIAFESVAAVTSLTGLSFLWYADYPRSSFHFFNDNKEWLQMDKIGHATAAYYISRSGYELLRWPGVDRKRAVWYGGATGFTYLAMIEIMDGFSSQWGASPGDLTANTLGTVAFVGQQLGWEEQRILLKWSYHQSRFAQYRPNILGKNLPERMLKDYNGQTYWLSANLRSFIPDSKFPKWLNVAFGFSAEGMIGGYFNPLEIKGKTLPSFERTRQYFLSLDVDLTRIETRSKALKTIFNLFGFLKIPFPAIEYNSGNQWKLYGVYF